MAIDVCSVFCEVWYKEDGELKSQRTELKGDEAKELSDILNDKDIPPVDWVAEAATVHQELSQVLLMLRRNGDERERVLYREMIKGLDKLRAIPEVGAELERRAAGRGATVAQRSARSPQNPSAIRRK